MTMLSAGLQVVGGFVQAAGAMQQAEAEAQAHEYNAAVAVRNQEIIRQQTKRAKQDQTLQNQRELHAIKAKYAANGIPLTGSALDVMADTAREQELDKQRIQYKGKLLILEQKDEYNMETMAAGTARTAGRISAAASILNGLTGAVGTFARAA